jgi:hypothetical protein
VLRDGVVFLMEYGYMRQGVGFSSRHCAIRLSRRRLVGEGRFGSGLSNTLLDLPVLGSTTGLSATEFSRTRPGEYEDDGTDHAKNLRCTRCYAGRTK